VVDRLIASPYRTVAMLGLSFKADTDDLRESPNVELAERLIGKGFDMRIYDPIVNPERLMGSNLRYVESRLPHLRRLLHSAPRETLHGCDVAVVATSDGSVIDELRAAPPAWILDLHGRLGNEIERLPGYEGIGWSV
jgi:GDP-mannose 6-dehydrogenase